jgi:tryptophan synthase alpha chain
MGRIQDLFIAKRNLPVLSIFCTAGYPQRDSIMDILTTLQASGADMVELGIPYSDPLADGPVIQHSNKIALDNGITVEKIFHQIRDMRAVISIPVLLMGYMNSVLQYGFARFCKDAAACGVDGLILPDLPPEEFKKEFSQVVAAARLNFVFLVTPQTSEARTRRLDALSSGFLYAVSSSATTGGITEKTEMLNYLRRLKSLSLKNPLVVGFGIRNKADLDAACSVADGAIIGSAYIKALENSTDVKAATKSFISSLLD